MARHFPFRHLGQGGTLAAETAGQERPLETLNAKVAWVARGRSHSLLEESKNVIPISIVFQEQPQTGRRGPLRWKAMSSSQIDYPKTPKNSSGACLLSGFPFNCCGGTVSVAMTCSTAAAGHNRQAAGYYRATNAVTELQTRVPLQLFNSQRLFRHPCRFGTSPKRTEWTSVRVQSFSLQSRMGAPPHETRSTSPGRRAHS